jgi:hypothetical protein
MRLLGAIEGDVTGKRNFSEEMSGNRNADNRDDFNPIPPAHGCAECSEPFAPGQTRFPYLQFLGCFWHGDKLKHQIVIASMCRACFDDALRHVADCMAKWGPYGQSGTIWGQELGLARVGELATRCDSECEGCGESIHTIVNGRDRHWQFCSNRCYQRDYRKRRRGRDSVVDWKGRRPYSHCAVCKEPLDRFGEPHKRKDALYCSSRCRQWAYRRRHSLGPPALRTVGTGAT